MNEKTIRSLNKIKELVDEDRRDAKYIRMYEAKHIYQLDERAIRHAAKCAGALLCLNRVTLIEINQFDRYFRKHFKTEEE